MARREASRDPRAIRTRGTILATLTDLLREQRVAEISVSRIVADAQVSRQAFYEHFDDKEAAVAGAVEAMMTPELNRIRTNYIEDGDMERALHDFFALLQPERKMLSNIVGGPAHAKTLEVFTAAAAIPAMVFVSELETRVGPQDDRTAEDVVGFLTSGSMSSMLEIALESETVEEATQRSLHLFSIIARALGAMTVAS